MTSLILVMMMQISAFAQNAKSLEASTCEACAKFTVTTMGELKNSSQEILGKTQDANEEEAEREHKVIRNRQRKIDLASTAMCPDDDDDDDFDDGVSEPRPGHEMSFHEKDHEQKMSDSEDRSLLDEKEFREELAQAEKTREHECEREARRKLARRRKRMIKESVVSDSTQMNSASTMGGIVAPSAYYNNPTSQFGYGSSLGSYQTYFGGYPNFYGGTTSGYVNGQRSPFSLATSSGR